MPALPTGGLPPGVRHTIIGAKRPTSKAPRQPAKAPAVANRRALPPETARELGPEWAEHFYRLVDAEASIDRALELKRHELSSTLANEGTPLSCSPLPMLRTLRVFVRSSMVKQPGDGTGPERCQFKLKIWAQPHLDATEAAEAASMAAAAAGAIPASVSELPPAALGEPIAMSKYLSVVRVDINVFDSSAHPPLLNLPILVEHRPQGNESGVEIGPKTCQCAPQETYLMARIAVRQRQPASGNNKEVPASARVIPKPMLASCLGLRPGSHFSYAEVEEALWLLIKEKRLLEVSKASNQAYVRITGCYPLCQALGLNVPQGGGVDQKIKMDELLKYVNTQLGIFELPGLRHTLKEGDNISAFDLVVSEMDPLITHRRQCLQKLNQLHASSRSLYGKQEAEVSEIMARLNSHVRKRRWLEALIYEDGEARQEEDESPGSGTSLLAKRSSSSGGGLGASASGGAGAAAADEPMPDSEEQHVYKLGGPSDRSKPPPPFLSTTPKEIANMSMEQVEEQMSSYIHAHAQPGRPVRSLEDFMNTLLRSQQHAGMHSLGPMTLRQPALPPTLPGDEPPLPNGTGGTFESHGTWASAAAKEFVKNAKGKKPGQ